MTRGEFIRRWVPVIICMLVIFTASTDLMSAEHTSRFIGPFLRWLVPEISAATIVAVQLLVRKLAHVTEYALLASLLLRALRPAPGEAMLPRAVTALAVAGACAALDEFHQSFVASRTGSPRDVMIDVAGAVIGVAIYWFILKRLAGRAAETVPR